VHRKGHRRSSQISVIEKEWRNDQKNVSVSSYHSPRIISVQISSRFTRILSEAANEEL
jgi:hypothetical protein